MIKYFCDVCGKETILKNGILSVERCFTFENKIIEVMIHLECYRLCDGEYSGKNIQICKECIEKVVQEGHLVGEKL